LALVSLKPILIDGVPDAVRHADADQQVVPAERSEPAVEGALIDCRSRHTQYVIQPAGRIAGRGKDANDDEEVSA
jgi:hypothetical protein